jgi:hypothetical protein
MWKKDKMNEGGDVLKKKIKEIAHQKNENKLVKVPSKFFIDKLLDASKMKVESRKDLFYLIYYLFGIHIPYKATSEEFCSPFDVLAKAYFEEEANIVWVGPRGGGKTLSLAILHILNSIMKPGCRSMHVAAVKEQAFRCQEYLTDFAERFPIKNYISSRPTKYRAEFKNGSFFSISTGTVVGVSGGHPHKATGDEVEFWEWNTLQQFLGCAQPSLTIKETVILCSTRQTVSGTMNRLVDESEDRGFSVYTTSIFESMAPCERCLCKIGGGRIDPSQCELWDECKGERGMKARGFLPREYLIKQKKKVDPDVWETQYLCFKPTTRGAVYFNLNLEDSFPLGNLWQVGFNPTLPVYLAVDPGVSSAYYVGAFQYYPDADLLHLFDEVVFQEGQVTEKVKIELEKKPWVGHVKEVIIDSRRLNEIEEFRTERMTSRKYSVVPSLQGRMAGEFRRVDFILEGVQRLRSRICSANNERRFTINPDSCPFAMFQMKSYRFSTTPSGMLTEKPRGENDDAPDAIRYMNDYVEYVLKSGASDPPFMVL